MLFALAVLLCACQERSKSGCYANLKQIEGAKATWAAEHGMTNRPLTKADLAGYFGKHSWPECPIGGNYVIGRIDEDAKCTMCTNVQFRLP